MKQSQHYRRLVPIVPKLNSKCARMSGFGPWYGRCVDEDTKAKEGSSDGAREGM